MNNHFRLTLAAACMSAFFGLTAVQAQPPSPAYGMPQQLTPEQQKQMWENMQRGGYGPGMMGGYGPGYGMGPGMMGGYGPGYGMGPGMTGGYGPGYGMGPGMMGGYGPGYGMGPGMMGGYGPGYGMGPGMMGGYGPGYGMGPGMMGGYGPGYGMGPGMMGGYGPGYGMGPGMMGGYGPGYGMGPGMMGPGMMGGYGFSLNESQIAQLDKIHDKLQEKHRKLMSQMWEEQGRLTNLYSAEKRDSAAIANAHDKLAKLQSEAIEARIEAENKFYEVLTKEQKAQVRRGYGWGMMGY